MSSVQLKKGPYTVDELFALQDEKRYEIYDGEIDMVPPPMLTHQHASKELQYLLTRYVKENDWGDIFNAPVGLILDQTNYVEPDLVCVSNDRMDILTDRGIEGAPDLVVEILSPSTKDRDLGVKSTIYARFASPHYWILNPMNRSLTVFELRDGEMQEMAHYSGNDLFEPNLFPGLEIPVGELWFEKG